MIQFGAGLFRAGGLSYLANRSLGGMAFDAGELALTFVPAGVGSGSGMLLRNGAKKYLADPAAWRAENRAMMRERGERGALDIDALGNVLVNGRRPVNSADWAGKNYSGEHWTAALKIKYSEGVKFTAAGFPDFSRYVQLSYVFEHGFTGVRAKDFKLADKAMGWATKPTGYIWHHAEDGKTLQLIPKDLHNAIRHTGGHAVARPPR